MLLKPEPLPAFPGPFLDSLLDVPLVFQLARGHLPEESGLASLEQDFRGIDYGDVPESSPSTALATR
jgi:hypothetical protein